MEPETVIHFFLTFTYVVLGVSFLIQIVSGVVRGFKSASLALIIFLDILISPFVCKLIEFVIRNFIDHSFDLTLSQSGLSENLFQHLLFIVVYVILLVVSAFFDKKASDLIMERFSPTGIVNRIGGLIFGLMIAVLTTGTIIWFIGLFEEIYSLAGVEYFPNLGKFNFVGYYISFILGL